MSNQNDWKIEIFEKSIVRWFDLFGIISALSTSECEGQVSLHIFVALNQKNWS